MAMGFNKPFTKNFWGMANRCTYIGNICIPPFQKTHVHGCPKNDLRHGRPFNLFAPDRWGVHLQRKDPKRWNRCCQLLLQSIATAMAVQSTRVQSLWRKSPSNRSRWRSWGWRWNGGWDWDHEDCKISPRINIQWLELFLDYFLPESWALEMGSPSRLVSFRVIFHFHDDGRKGKYRFKGLLWFGPLVQPCWFTQSPERSWDIKTQPCNKTYKFHPLRCRVFGWFLVRCHSFKANFLQDFNLTPVAHLIPNNWSRTKRLLSKPRVETSSLMAMEIPVVFRSDRRFKRHRRTERSSEVTGRTYELDQCRRFSKHHKKKERIQSWKSWFRRPWESMPRWDLFFAQEKCAA